MRRSQSFEECREEQSGRREQREQGHSCMCVWYVWGSLRFLLRLPCRGVVAVRLDRLGEIHERKP